MDEQLTASLNKLQITAMLMTLVVVIIILIY